VNAGAVINDSSGDDFSVRLSNDGKALYYASNRSGGFGAGDLYVATRASAGAPWSRADNLGSPLNTDAFEAFPTPSADGLTLFFNRSTTFDSQDSDIWVSTRARADEPWSMPHRVLGAINSERAEFSPALSPDGNRLYFASERDGGVELWVATRGANAEEWGAPAKLGAEVNVPRSMTLAPFIANDQRSLYFMAARQDLAAAGACTPGTCFDRLDLYVSTVRCR
jgi:Tol biopolymer transport system component